LIGSGNTHSQVGKVDFLIRLDRTSILVVDRAAENERKMRVVVLSAALVHFEERNTAFRNSQARATRSWTSSAGVVRLMAVKIIRKDLNTYVNKAASLNSKFNAPRLRWTASAVSSFNDV
jgi:hypothetical protein